MKKLFSTAEYIVTAAALGAMIILPAIEILSRLIFSTGLSGYDIQLRHVTLWAAMAAASIATLEKSHISFGFTGQITRQELIHAKRWIKRTVASTGAVFSIFMAVSGLSFILIAFDPQQKVGFVPVNIAAAVIPLAFLMMTARFVCEATACYTLSPTEKQRLSSSVIKNTVILLPVILVAGLLISLPAVINLMYLTPVYPPEWTDRLIENYYLFFGKVKWALIIYLIAMTVAGLPIYILLGGCALVLFNGNWGSPEVIPNEIYNLLTGSAIPAIPLFTLAGFILSQGKTGERLVALFQALLGKIPGGLAIMAVLVCAFFTTFTGASGVTILALGGILAFILTDSGGYTEKFSRGLLTSSGSIGLLFPPSLPIIMYAVTAQISVKDMFLAGLIPGLLLAAALSAAGIYHNRKIIRKKTAGKNTAVTEKKQTNNKPLYKALIGAGGDILLPVVILVLYFGGITTLIETGAVAVIWALVLETVILRELKISHLKKVIKRAAPVIGGVLIILAAARGLSYYIVDAGVPELLTGFLKERITSPLTFILLLNLVLLVTGCLMDIYSAIMVVAPLIIPLGEMYGIHPVQLGIIFLANLQLGYLTPPVGMNLFLASYSFKVPLGKIYKGVVPFFLILLLMVLLISYVPWISTALI